MKHRDPSHPPAPSVASVPLWLLLIGACAGGGSRPAPVVTPRGPVLTAQSSGTTQRLQAVSPVSDQVVWVSGTGGTYARTIDGGATWRPGVVPGADSLEFRDVQGIDSRVAYLLSSGPGPRSRIYKTVDGGLSWSLQFTSADSAAFYDCLSFWDVEHGLAMSDAVNGHFPVLVTEDGGRWTSVAEAALPPAQPGEGAFAASGTCVVTAGKRAAWIGTGASTGGGKARVLRSDDRGAHWTVAETPVVHGTSTTGITSLAFRDALHGAALGGDIAGNEIQHDNVAITDDGGRTWKPAGSPGFKGAIFGGAWVPGTAGTLVAVGPGGSSYSTDAGMTWQPLDLQNYWSVGFSGGGIGWLVGPGGRITRVSFERP